MTAEAADIIERLFKAFIFVPCMGLIALEPDSKQDRAPLKRAQQGQSRKHRCWPPWQ